MRTFFAGLEGSPESFPLMGKGMIEDGFFSYYYMRSNPTTTDVMRKARSLIPGLVVVDSGAHTFFSEDNTGKTVSVHVKQTKTQEDPQTYFEGYVSWIRENWDFFDYFVELDIGELVGQDRVLKWREWLKSEGLYSKCITVFHPACVSWGDYLSMLEDSQSRYVALEGFRAGSKPLPYLKLIREAYSRGIRTHGFAMTKKSVYYSFPFFSVDSSSWKAGSQYGSMIMRSDGDLRGVRYSDPDAVSRADLEPGLDVLVSGRRGKRQRASADRISVASAASLARSATRFWALHGINY